MTQRMTDRMIRLAALPLAMMSAACMTTTQPDRTEPEDEVYQRKPAGNCDAAPAQVHIGKTVTAQLGAEIQAETGARSLRWGPPNSAWTMDYREDRVNVRYDEKMIITAITCG